MQVAIFDYSEVQFYKDLELNVLDQLKYEKNLLANLSNLTSLVFHNVPDLNWCGFYFLEPSSRDLVLGPFQGKMACTRIPISRGVCGAAFSQHRVICVDDVHSFPGHIACDSASKSELVIPFRFGVMGSENFLEGVFDIDSPLFSRFSIRDIDGLQKLIDGIRRFLH